MVEPIAIVCVKVGDKYDAEYVNRLYSMIKINVKFEHKFICYTDDATDICAGVIIKPPPCEYIGWWSKLGLFKEDLDTEGLTNILYFDLDVVIISDLSDLVKNLEKHSFSIMQDKMYSGYNSSVMLFKKGKYSSLFTEFKLECINGHNDIANLKFRGDQDWINFCCQDLYRLPSVLSYKIDCRNMQELPYNKFPNIDVVVFHGRPRPNDEEPQKLNWVRKYYHLKPTGIEPRRRCFCIGNGKSREDYDLNKLRGKGFTIGCNALYDDFSPDILVAVDAPMQKEIMDSSYKGLTAFRNYTNLFYVYGKKIPDEAFASGPTSLLIALALGFDEIFFIGHDCNLTDVKDNVYLGRKNYQKEGFKLIVGNFTGQLQRQIAANPQVNFIFVNKWKQNKSFFPFDNVSFWDYNALRWSVGC